MIKKTSIVIFSILLGALAIWGLVGAIKAMAGRRKASDEDSLFAEFTE